MKLFQALAVTALLALTSNVSAQSTLAELYNNTVVDVCVEGQTKGSCQRIPSKRSGQVYIRDTQWIEFGMEALRYNVPKTFLKPGLKLQAEPGGKLYLLPADATLPAPVPPKQPSGFPLVPKERVDLT